MPFNQFQARHSQEYARHQPGGKRGNRIQAVIEQDISDFKYQASHGVVTQNHAGRQFPHAVLQRVENAGEEKHDSKDNGQNILQIRDIDAQMQQPQPAAERKHNQYEQDSRKENPCPCHRDVIIEHHHKGHKETDQHLKAAYQNGVVQKGELGNVGAGEQAAVMANDGHAVRTCSAEKIPHRLTDCDIRYRVWNIAAKHERKDKQIDHSKQERLQKPPEPAQPHSVNLNAKLTFCIINGKGEVVCQSG